MGVRVVKFWWGSLLGGVSRWGGNEQIFGYWGDTLPSLPVGKTLRGVVSKEVEGIVDGGWNLQRNYVLKSSVVRRLIHKANPFLAINHTPNQFITKWFSINVFGVKTVYFNKKSVGTLGFKIKFGT